MPAENLRTILASLSTTVHISDVEPGIVRLDLISVPEELREQGCARDALAQIAQWADETATIVVLTATFALGANLRRLIELYMSVGFTPVEMTPLYEVPMRREPRAQVPALIPEGPRPAAHQELTEPED